jgi:hypothetical protein
MGFGGGRRLIVGVVAGVVLAGCTAEPAVEGDPGQAVEPTEVSASEAGDLRLALEQGFALHAHAVAALVRSPSKTTAAAKAAVGRSNQELGRIVADVYDDEAATSLRKTLAPLADELLAYRRQAADADGPGGAVRDLPGDLAAFMRDVTSSTMERNGTRELAQAGVDRLIAVTESTAQGDLAAAYGAERDAFAAMIDLGRAFAAGIIEHQRDRYPGTRSNALLELRSALRQFLSEHALLTVTVTRAGVGEARDFKAAAAALNGNTEDLVAALESIYGADVEPFTAQWRQRISTLADYNVAAAGGLQTRRRQARNTLAELDEGVAVALQELTGDAIARRRMRSAMRRLTTEQLRQVDAFVQQRYDRAERAKTAAYRQSLLVADRLAEGVAESRPEEFG